MNKELAQFMTDVLASLDDDAEIGAEAIEAIGVALATFKRRYAAKMAVSRTDRVAEVCRWIKHDLGNADLGDQVWKAFGFE
jgi:hypothetical protein